MSVQPSVDPYKSLELVHDDAGLERAEATVGHDTQLLRLLAALQAMRAGDFSVRMPGHETGLFGKIADTFNDIVAANEHMAQQLDHVGQVVGRDGKTRTRVRF